MNHTFNDVTLLITNYNRSLSLENLLRTFQTLDCHFGAIIVTDDGSQPLHLDRIKKLQQIIPFQLLTSTRNMGAGYNMNKGQRAVKTPYTLFVEDDFEAGAQFPAALRESLDQMNKRSDLDIVRFYAYFRYPYLKPCSAKFSEMVFSPLATNYRKVHYYSDHPHLRRSSFLDKFGAFDETTPPDQTEYRMCISFLQNKGKGLFYTDYTGLFYHNNSVEPSTIQRSGWQKSSSALVTFARVIYRQLKHNYDIHFMNVRDRQLLVRIK